MSSWTWMGKPWDSSPNISDVVVDDAIDRTKLAAHVLDASIGQDNLKLIEGIIHPLVIRKRKEFYEEAKQRGSC